jgi:hypothetical protein
LQGTECCGDWRSEHAGLGLGFGVAGIKSAVADMERHGGRHAAGGMDYCGDWCTSASATASDVAHKGAVWIVFKKQLGRVWINA